VNKLIKLTAALLLASAVASCASAPDPKDFTAFRQADPHSILIVPVINHSAEAEAADIFLSTMAVPLAERGFYVFPTNMVKALMENEGLSDPQLVHSADTTTTAGLFGADSVIYIEILDWNANYSVVGTGVNVEFIYSLKDGKTGQLLWQDQQSFYHDYSANSGNIFADLIANAVIAAANNTRSDYSNVAINANAVAIAQAGQGVPHGPYSPEYQKDEKDFPSTGNGNISDATLSAVSTEGIYVPETAE
jgi:hypothetical protein